MAAHVRKPSHLLKISIAAIPGKLTRWVSTAAQWGSRDAAYSVCATRSATDPAPFSNALTVSMASASAALSVDYPHAGNLPASPDLQVDS